MKDLVATVEEDKGDYYSTILHFPSFLQDSYAYTLFGFLLVVVGLSNICEDDFPDHVKEMHQDRDQKFEMEYKVSTA